MRKLVCALAVRNNGSRLYGKPIQNLDVNTGYRILDFILETIKNQIEVVDDICLAISEGADNETYIKYAQENNYSYVIGSEQDVLQRLIQAAKEVNATDVLRITSESPFVSYDLVDKAWRKHLYENNDATFYDEVVDGCGFEIITLESLISSHKNGDDTHRSELCTLYIRENKEHFRIGYLEPDKALIRNDLRLTVDNPEDLILCRAIYQDFKQRKEEFKLENIIAFIDDNVFLKELVLKYTIEGYKSMYK